MLLYLIFNSLEKKNLIDIFRPKNIEIFLYELSRIEIINTIMYGLKLTEYLLKLQIHKSNSHKRFQVWVVSDSIWYRRIYKFKVISSTVWKRGRVKKIGVERELEAISNVEPRRKHIWHVLFRMKQPKWRRFGHNKRTSNNVFWSYFCVYIYIICNIKGVAI